jgi:hypothetical protein
MKRHSREYTREQSIKHKNRIRRKVRSNLYYPENSERAEKLLSPESVGKLESVHMCSCSCHLCGNARRFWGSKTIPETKFEEDADKELRDLEESDG